jgi:predicted DNA-binding antitoxin AbrB/MazE fold protein
MAIEVDATYEDGVLRPDKPLPLRDHERVSLSVRPPVSGIRQTAGLIGFQGTADAFDYLLARDNQSFDGIGGCL